MSGAERLCYNRGCGAKFNPDENHKDACTYHPGAPYFHDAYKGWSCCKKKTVDFTEFLNTKGCTKGFHCDVKPEEPVAKPAETPVADVEEPVMRAPLPPANAPKQPRPSFDAPLVLMKLNVGGSLRQALLQAEKARQSDDSGGGENGADNVATSASCTNHGCNERRDSCSPHCCYHSGTPVFHEGMKYWSCCQRKTSDFDSFLSQPGCCTGPHSWTVKQKVAAGGSGGGGGKSGAVVRHDWHQTGSCAVVTLYVRCPLPDRCCVEIGPVRLRLRVVYGADQQQQQDQEEHVVERDWHLFDAVDPERSSVQLLATKVEITLRKVSLTSWRSLAIASPSSDLPPQPPESSADQTCDPSCPDVSARVEAVDLSDL